MTKQLLSFSGLLLIFNLLFSLNCAAVELIRLNTVVEMNIGESQKIRLTNGDIINVSLLDVIIQRDSLRGAVRGAWVNTPAADAFITDVGPPD
jgi:hypothetical protein